MSCGCSYFQLHAFEVSQATERAPGEAPAPPACTTDAGADPDGLPDRPDAAAWPPRRRPTAAIAAGRRIDADRASRYRRSSSRAGSSSSCCRWRCSALWALARAAGIVVLISSGRAVALILNPLVRMLLQRGVPRGLAILARLHRHRSRILAGIGVLLADPVSTQVGRVRGQPPALHRRGQPRPRRPPELAEQARDQGADRAAGPDRARRRSRSAAQELQRHRVVLPRSAHARS